MVVSVFLCFLLIIFVQKFICEPRFNSNLDGKPKLCIKNIANINGVFR